MTRLPVRRLALSAAALALLSLTGGATAGPTVTARADAARVPACATGNLVVWLGTSGNGTTGSTYYELRLTNLSRRRCTLRGYPGVSATDLSGHQLGSAAARSAHSPVRTIELAPGHAARAVLQIADTGVFSAATCRPTTAAGLRVYPPGERASKLVPFPFHACTRRGPAYLHVEAVQSLE